MRANNKLERHRASKMLRGAFPLQFLELTPRLSTVTMTPWLSFSEGDPGGGPSGSTGVAMAKDTDGRRTSDAGTAGVIARPPLLFLGALLLGGVLDLLLPFPVAIPGGDLVRWTIAGALILAGLVLAAAGIRNFSRAGTPVPTNEPTRALVTSGIHGWTRNPIYLGLFLVYFGIGMGVQSAWILILTLPLAITIRYGVVAREEAYLESRFGDAYRTYKARVRRWL